MFQLNKLKLRQRKIRKIKLGFLEGLIPDIVGGKYNTLSYYLKFLIFLFN